MTTARSDIFTFEQNLFRMALHELLQIVAEASQSLIGSYDLKPG